MRAWVSGLHPHTPLALPRASSAPGAGPALRPYKLVPLLCRVLLELVPLTPRFCFFFSPAGVLVFGLGGGGFSSSNSHQVSCPQGGLGCPLWQEVGPGAPAWRCMWSGCAVSRACRACAPPPRPSAQTAGLQPPGRDTGGGTLGLEERAPGPYPASPSKQCRFVSTPQGPTPFYQVAV